MTRGIRIAQVAAITCSLLATLLGPLETVFFLGMRTSNLKHPELQGPVAQKSPGALLGTRVSEATPAFTHGFSDTVPHRGL